MKRLYILLTMLLIASIVLPACAPKAESTEEINWVDVSKNGTACTEENFKDGYLQPGTFLWRPVNPDMPMTAHEEKEGLPVGEQFEIRSEFVAKTDGVYKIVTAENAGWINGFPAHPLVKVQGITLVLTNATCVPENISEPTATPTQSAYNSKGDI